LPTKKSAKDEIPALVTRARELLEDKKGVDIVLMDVRKTSGVADYFLLVTGTSAPHVRALADEVQFTLKHEGIQCLHRSGSSDSGWIVVDYADVIIHILSPQARKYYSIEDLWAGVRRQER
jgi:ribosome-associated protein